MMPMHRSLPFVLSVLLAGVLVAQGEQCTIGVACGKATADGRPLLWKNRDAHQRDNVVMALADGTIPYFALCDAGNAAAVWGGANVAGFGVVSAVSRDLPEASAAGPDNGAFAKMALQRCTTLAEFETLLKETAGARRTRANFGVIDAAGGASFFEVGPGRHERFDAAASSDGMLVRTNFATTAGGERGRERFARAEALCRSAASKPLTCRFLLQQFLRDLQPPPSAEKGDAGRQDARETINRQTTVAGLVLAGVAPGEDTRWTTMWTLLGQPLFTIAVPLWPAAAAVPRDLAGDPRSALCDASKRFQDAFYEPTAAAAAEAPGGDAAEADASPSLRWLRIDRVPLARRTLLFTEADLLARVEERLEQWRAPGRDPPTPAAMRAFQELLAKQAVDGVTRLARQFAVAAK